MYEGVGIGLFPAVGKFLIYSQCPNDECKETLQFQIDTKQDLKKLDSSIIETMLESINGRYY